MLARLVAAQEAQRARSLHHGLGVAAREERGAHADCAARQGVFCTLSAGEEGRQTATGGRWVRGAEGNNVRNEMD